MEKYDSDKINEIARTISIADYIIKGGEDPEKKVGHNWYFKCKQNPNEEHASCCVDVDRNYYTCYSCHNAGSSNGSGGNLVAYMINEEGMTYPQAADRVLALVGISPDDATVVQRSATLKYLKSLQKKTYDPTAKRIYGDYADYDKFSKQPSETWIKEGITAEVQRLYDIRTDPLRNRIMYPLLDQGGRYITYKYRNDLPSDILKTMGIPKYMISTEHGRVGCIDFLVGWKQAQEAVKQTGEVILAESIKSAMKVRVWGVNNVVACETSAINKEQIKFLIKNQVRNVVIAFDKDKKPSEIRKRLWMLPRFANVSIIEDRDNLLGDKDSPMDCGFETYKQLYEKRRRIN